MSGTYGPGPAPGSGGGSISVTDGITTVDPATSLSFTSGATVTDGGGGVAQVAVSGGGITGLTTNTIPVATSSTTLGDSRIVSNATDIIMTSPDGLSLIDLANASLGFLASDGVNASGLLFSNTSLSFFVDAATMALNAVSLDIAAVPINVGSPSGSASPGDINITGNYLVNGVAIGGGSISVTDGTTTVNPATSLSFTSGATVTDGGGGVAQVAVSGGGITDPGIVLSGTVTGSFIITLYPPSGFMLGNEFIPVGVGVTVSYGDSQPGLSGVDMGTVEAWYDKILLAAPSATSFVASSLKYVDSDFLVDFSSATTVDLSALQVLAGEFASNFSSVPSLDLSALRVSANDLDFNIASAVSLDLSSAEILLGVYLTGGNAASLQTVSLTSSLKQLGGNFHIIDAALDEASVDNILVRLAALDGTGGTTSWDNKSVDLSGGTSATPSATGLAAKVTLVGRGNTVATN